MDEKGYKGSVVFTDSSLSTPRCQEENEGEANAVLEMMKALLEEGKCANDIAVITPFRKQVRLLRGKTKEIISQEEIPLIDTVERLQGQDVDCIILTFASSDEKYINEIHDFLFNPNRLNVMISRAKTKVVIYGSKKVQEMLNLLLK